MTSAFRLGQELKVENLLLIHCHLSIHSIFKLQKDTVWSFNYELWQHQPSAQCIYLYILAFLYTVGIYNTYFHTCCNLICWWDSCTYLDILDIYLDIKNGHISECICKYGCIWTIHWHSVSRCSIQYHYLFSQVNNFPW